MKSQGFFVYLKCSKPKQLPKAVIIKPIIIAQTFLFIKSPNEPIISYMSKGAAILELTNREDDKPDLMDWLGHIIATLRTYWKDNCPVPYLLYELPLDRQKESDKILDFLEAESLYL